MGTRYDAVTLAYNVDFDHDGENASTVALTDAARDDPRWLAFLDLFHELRDAEIRAEIAAKGVGNLTFAGTKADPVA